VQSYVVMLLLRCAAARAEDAAPCNQTSLFYALSYRAAAGSRQRATVTRPISVKRARRRVQQYAEPSMSVNLPSAFALLFLSEAFFRHSSAPRPLFDHNAYDACLVPRKRCRHVQY